MMSMRILKIIGILSLLSVVLNLGRFILTGYGSYLWLNWNLFLALVPLLFSWWAIRAKSSWVSGFAIVLWLGFLPNAPYLITDFIHMADVGPRSYLWYDAIMIFSYSLVGIIAWIVSLHMIKKHFAWKQWTIWFISFLTGFGIYLGRYIRFNTWHIITQPLDILETIGDIIIRPSSHQPVVMMTLTFTLVLGTLYSISLFTHYEKTKN